MASDWLIDPHGLAGEFLDEWNNDKEYVTAHTSGSTGSPKEVRLLKSDMIASARATCRFFDVTPASVLHLPLSVDYIAGKMMVVRALVSGARLIVSKPSLAPLSELCCHADLSAIVPAQAEAFVRGLDRCSVGSVIVGGAPLSPAQETILRQASVRAYASYGMTETCSHVALRCISTGERCFEALPDISFSSDSRGCLVVESGERSFGRLVTNDVVGLIDSSHFIWRGRADNIINTGGIKVVPEELEVVIAPLLHGRPFFITSRPSEKWGSELILVVEGDKAGCDNLREDIIRNASALLPQRLLPKDIIFHHSLSRTSSGKIIRKI